MFLLVFFELCAFDVDQLDLSVQILFDHLVVFDLLVEVVLFLVNGLFLLTDPVFGVIDLFVALECIPFVGGL